jgi:hypothetical protein
LVERLNGIQKVGSSILPGSTIYAQAYRVLTVTLQFILIQLLGHNKSEKTGKAETPEGIKYTSEFKKDSV